MPEYLSLKWDWGKPLVKVAEVALSREVEINTKHGSYPQNVHISTSDKLH